ncbi:MAG: hypothetical protein O7H39_17245 [Gammaproteobacteria bacterium]|nr:hypothetical protein [Gammaproteobacteria bacterium]
MGQAQKGLIAVGLFAIAMAYVESAVVVYLRAVYGIEDQLQDLPQLSDLYTLIEIGRETSTLVMLVIIGWIAGRRRQDRIGYAVFAFGLWDIFYYVWLVIFIGWPTTLLDWDVLFLIPLPWWGPVLAPTLIALLLVVGGGMAVLKSERGEVLRFTLVEWSVVGVSTLLALYVFMLDALHAIPEGIDAVSNVRPSSFNWPLFIMALIGMAFSLLSALWTSSHEGRSDNSGS